MRLILMVFGMTAMLGSGVLGFQAKKQINEDPMAPITMASLLSGLQGQVMNLAGPAPKRDARQASLPQIKSRPRMQTLSVSGSGMSAANMQQEVEAVIASNPMLQAAVNADRKASRDSFWSRLRRMARDDGDAGGRLDAINKRNESRRATLSIEEIASMDQGEVLKNITAASQTLDVLSTDNYGNQRQLEDLIRTNPQLRALAEGRTHAPKETLWSQIRKKVGGGDAPARAKPSPVPGFSMDKLAKVNEGEIASSIADIQRALQGAASLSIGAQDF